MNVLSIKISRPELYISCYAFLVVDIHYNQAGFRKDHSIIDHIILLKNLSDLYTNNNKNYIVLSLTILKPLILYGAKDCGISY